MEGIMDSVAMSLSRLREWVMDREAWRAAVYGVSELDMTEQLNWTDMTHININNMIKLEGVILHWKKRVFLTNFDSLFNNFLRKIKTLAILFLHPI